MNHLSRAARQFVEMETNLHPLKRYLKQTGLTVCGFAALIGVSRQTLHRILAGAQSPKPALARRIVDAVGGAVSFEELYRANGDGAGVADLTAARATQPLKSECRGRAAPNQAPYEPLNLTLLAGAVKSTLDRFADDCGAGGVCSDEVLGAAAEAVASTHAALAHVTTRRGRHRLAQALRPVLEEILKDSGAAGDHPGRIRRRVDEASDHAARLYFQAQRLKHTGHASK